MIARERALLLLVVLAKCSWCANILYVAPLASPSHHIWNRALALGLVEKGHNVTMLTHDAEKVPPPKNYTSIVMEGIYDVLYKDFDLDEYANETIMESITMLYAGYTKFICHHDYNTTGLETLLSYPKDYKFDLIIIDVTLGRCLHALIERFHNPPTVAVTPFLLPPALSDAFGNHIHTSYIPYYSTKYNDKMNFKERILNFLYTYADIFYRKYIYLPEEDALMRDRFGRLSSSPDELEKHISLLLCNTDPILEYPVPLPPNIIPVGGLHARPARALPKDLQKIMDDAKHGVIVFSLGTNVRSDKLNLAARQGLMEAFVKLPQVVLWKFESDDIKELPKNVFIRKWLPQNDLLAHPNIKLFINHGGALSSQEAMYHGVPVISIPFFADQHVNVRKMEDKKVAKHLDRTKLTCHNVYQTIKEVLDNDVYRDNMRTLSRKYRDQPQTALERAVFWIEHVLRHGGAEHLVSASRNMPSYQTANLDILVVAVLGLGLTYSFLLFSFTLCRFAVSLVRSGGTAKSAK